MFIAFQIAEAKIPQIKSQLSEYALHVWDNRYLCRKGGWMWYRLTDTWQINDIRLLLNAKIKPKKQYNLFSEFVLISQFPGVKLLA